MSLGDGVGGGDDGVLSDVEIILPSEIIESLSSLKPESLSCFMSVDEKSQTTRQLFLHKLTDNSVRIRVTVMVLGTGSQKLNRDKEIKDSVVEKSVSHRNAETQGTEIVSENGHELTALKRKLKPSIANPLNRKLTSIWRSKRKKTFKNIHLRSTALPVLRKNLSAKSVVCTKRPDPGTSATDADDDDSKSLMNKIESLNSDGATVVINAKSVGDEVKGRSQKQSDDEEFQGFDLLPGSSTVIILKTVVAPSPLKTVTEDESHLTSSVECDLRLSPNAPRLPTPRNNSMQKPDDEKPKITSRDIAERLKARERKGVPQVSCELCGEIAESYVSLYRHIKKQHDDCTFVRNYLEEIEPLACTPCPICKKPFTTPTSLTAHISSAHPQTRKPSRPQLSKLSAQRHHIAAEKRRAQTPSEESSDDEEEDESIGPFICKICGKQVDDIVKYRRHTLTHGEFRFPCEHCDKRFRMKDNLTKHVHRIHGKATETKDRAIGFRSTTTVAPGKGSSAGSKGGSFKCDRCRAVFNRTSQLVTHMRYCLKQKK